MTQRITSSRLDPATGRPLPDGVEYRGKGQYRARKRVPDGRRVAETFATAKLARQWLQTKSAEVELGQLKDTRSIDGLTGRDMIDRYVSECMQARDNDRIGHIPALLNDEIARLRLSDISRTEVRRFRDRQAARFEGATVVKRLNLLATIFVHAMSEWDYVLPENPATATAVKRPEGADQKRNRRLQGDEEQRLLEAVAKSGHPDDVAFVRFAIEQGMRRSEARTLRWRDVDFEAHSITLPKTKTMKHAKEKGPELRPLTPGAARLLKEIKAQRGETKPSKTIFDIGTGGAFSARYARIVAEAKIEDLTFHDLRHEATSRLALLYKNPLELRRVTGHKDIKSLDRYYQPLMKDLAHTAYEAEEKRLRGHSFRSVGARVEEAGDGHHHKGGQDPDQAWLKNQ